MLAAQAADPGTVEGFVGLEATMNLPFLVRRGVRFGGAWRPVPYLGVLGAVGVYPNLGRMDWRPVLTELVDVNGLAPTVSRVMESGIVTVELTPIRTAIDRVETALNVGIGGGAVRTVDVLGLGGLDDPPGASRNRDQVLPTWAWTLSAEVLSGSVGFRARYAQTRYVEQFGRARLRQLPVWLGAEVVFRSRRSGTPR